ncbi:MAG: SDR family oxidoreductase, partial [Thermoanaerobaculia bacterium]|nr:SDR family oxidoreductase [Thermoanaerobaculia bacterium]
MATEASDEGLDGRVAVVTGGGAAGDGIGNGRAACMLLARSGARVLVVDRKPELAQRTVEMIAAEGGEAAAFEADVTDSDDCAGMVTEATRLWSRLDVLINNVGVGSHGSVVDEPIESFEKVMRINVRSMVLASKHAIPAMIGGGAGGAIVNISSI